MTLLTDEEIETVRLACANEFAEAMRSGGYNHPRTFARAIEQAVLEQCAKVFDRRAVYADGHPSSGWYEVHEPAEIIRGLK